MPSMSNPGRTVWLIVSLQLILGAQEPAAGPPPQAPKVIPELQYKQHPGLAYAASKIYSNTPGLYPLTGRVLGARTHGMYFEPSYALYARRLPLFARFERLNTHARVAPSLQAVRANENDLSIVTLGANFVPKRNVIFKGNYQIRSNRSPFGQPEANLVEFGFGFIY